MKRLIFVSAFLLLLLTAAEAQTRVVAHRGYWTVDGCVENTLASLQNAADAKVWGSEFDVWITADGKAVVHHDATVDGLRIETARYKDVKKKRLKNGKRLPTLEEYLKLGRRLKDLRLVLELKPHKERANEDRCVAEVLRLVGKYGVAKQTEYISFSMHICEELVRRVPGVEVAYLGGNVSPEEAKKRGMLKQIHLSESEKEVTDALKEHRKTPVQLLRDIGFLDEHTSLAHCVQMRDDDIAEILISCKGK